MAMTLTTKRLGDSGEDYACRYLKSRGYQILARNFRCRRCGEIDIIAQRQGVLCFVEVKTRSSERYGLPREAVTASKQKKIYRCAEYYLQLRGYEEAPPLSFDVIEIWKTGTRIAALKHWPQCF